MGRNIKKMWGSVDYSKRLDSSISKRKIREQRSLDYNKCAGNYNVYGSEWRAGV